METWKEIPDTDGNYSVSDLGRVRGPKVVLSPGLSHNGYQLVAIRRGGRRVTVRVHRLVAEAFVDGWSEGLDACHVDGNKTNNLASNLRWGTRSQNILDQVRMGRHRNARKTHCPQGHEYSPDNIYTQPRGDRQCKKCRLEALRTKRLLRKVRHEEEQEEA